MSIIDISAYYLFKNYYFILTHNILTEEDVIPGDTPVYIKWHTYHNHMQHCLSRHIQYECWYSSLPNCLHLKCDIRSHVSLV